MNESKIFKVFTLAGLMLFICFGSVSGDKEIVTGKGAGRGNNAQVRGFTHEGDRLLDFLAFGYQHNGVNVASGDIDGNGVDDILAAPGPSLSFGPWIKCYDTGGANPNLMFSFLAYGFKKWGVNIATGDVDGDGIDEIITAPGPGPTLGAHIRGFEYVDGRIEPLNVSFILDGKHGANIACGDFDRDFMDEIITTGGAGREQTARVRGWNYDGDAVTPMAWIDFLGYGTQHYGANLACGDVDWDLVDEVFVGPGPSPAFGAMVKLYDPVPEDTAISHFLTYRAYQTGKSGVKLAGGNMDDDAYDEIITAPGPNPLYAAHVRGFNYDDSAIEGMADPNFFAYDSTVKHGAIVAAGDTDAVTYDIMDIGALPGAQFSVAIGINNAGHVTGLSQSGVEGHAFFWKDLNGNGQNDGNEMIDLGTLGGELSIAFRVNSAELVVGYSLAGPEKSGHGSVWDRFLDDFTRRPDPYRYASSAQEVPRAFLWKDLNSNHQNDPGELIDLGTLGGEESQATGINDSGQVVGGADTAQPNVVHAFIWKDLNGNHKSDPGEMVDLGTLDGGTTSSVAVSINNQGQVAGYSERSSGEVHAFLWEDLNGNGQSDPGEMRDLGTLGGAESVGASINDQAQVAGSSSTADNNEYGFIWDEDLGMKGIGRLVGINSCVPQHINASGLVVGQVVISDQFGIPFRYDNGEMKNLNLYVPAGSNWDLQGAFGGNDHGKIVGFGARGALYRGFVMTPSE